MPRKRKAATTKKGPTKKAKVGKEAGPSNQQQATQELSKCDKQKKTYKVDTHSGLGASGGEVHEDYDCVLTHTRKGSKKMKFYVMQVIKVIKASNFYYCWTRYGTVGDVGGQRLYGPFEDMAIKEFTRTFLEKTKNKWENRDQFETKSGKYIMVDMGDEEREGLVTTTSGYMYEPLVFS